MPLNTQIVRDDKPLVLRWGWWHVSCMFDAAESEGAKQLHRLKSEGSCTLTKAHEFVDETDGEILSLQPGDVLRMSR